jgi:lysylphosphatidylglycerol synthase-like protein
MLRRAGRAALLLAGVIALALVIRRVGATTIAGSIRRIGAAFWTITLLYALHTVLRGVTLWQALPAGSIRLRSVIRIRFAAEGIEMLTMTGPFLAEPAKAWLLHRNGLAPAAAFGAVAAEYLLYNLTAAWMAGAALSLLLARATLPHAVVAPAVGVLGAVVALTGGCAVAGITNRGLIAPSLGALVGLFSRGRGEAIAERLRDTESVLVSVLHDDPRRLAAILIVELAGHALLAFEIAVALHALGLQATLGSAFIIEGAVKGVASMFFFIPGQLGVSEGSYALLLQAMGLPAAAGVTIVLVRRARSLAIGGLGLLFAGGPRRPANDEIEPAPKC